MTGSGPGDQHFSEVNTGREQDFTINGSINCQQFFCMVLGTNSKEDLVVIKLVNIKQIDQKANDATDSAFFRSKRFAIGIGLT